MAEGPQPDRERLMGIAGVILAGGRSSRMGTNKAELVWQGKPLVRHVADQIQNAGICDIFVSGNVADYPSIPDRRAGYHGPVMGILSSMMTLQGIARAILFVPVDMPLLNEEVLAPLLQNVDKPRHFESSPLPCLMPLNKKTITYAECLLMKDSESFPVRRLMTELEAISLPVCSKHQDAFTNTNTPDDWEQANRIHRQRTKGHTHEYTF